MRLYVSFSSSRRSNNWKQPELTPAVRYGKQSFCSKLLFVCYLALACLLNTPSDVRLSWGAPYHRLYHWGIITPYDQHVTREALGRTQQKQLKPLHPCTTTPGLRPPLTRLLHCTPPGRLPACMLTFSGDSELHSPSRLQRVRSQLPAAEGSQQVRHHCCCFQSSPTTPLRFSASDIISGFDCLCRPPPC